MIYLRPIQTESKAYKITRLLTRSQLRLSTLLGNIYGFRNKNVAVAQVCSWNDNKIRLRCSTIFLSAGDNFSSSAQSIRKRSYTYIYMTKPSHLHFFLALLKPKQFYRQAYSEFIQSFICILVLPSSRSFISSFPFLFDVSRML